MKQLHLLILPLVLVQISTAASTPASDATDRFIGGRPAVGQSDADLLGDHPSFVHG